MITKQNVSKHELIGLLASAKGISGKIINETQKSLMIRHDGKAKRIMKENAVFELTLPEGQDVSIEGKEIAFRPWERISKS